MKLSVLLIRLVCFDMRYSPLSNSICNVAKFLQIVFVENKNLTSTLLDEIDKSQLPDIYGGKLPLVPIQDC